MADSHPPPPPTPPPPGAALAQLSDDRAYVWNGSAWAPAEFSPDGLWVWDGGTWRPATIPAPAAPAAPIAPPIEFDFPVAGTHKVALRLDQGNGQLTINVDGEYIVNETQQFSLSMSKQFRFNVGTDQPHAVIIEKRREMLMMGNRPYTWRIWIDDAYYGTFQGEAWVQAPA
jgi:hypothetical protein